MTSGPHLADDLPRLLIGEAAREEIMAAARHLRGCVDCRQELVSAVVAHAALTSAHRFAPELLELPAELPELLELPAELPAAVPAGASAHPAVPAHPAGEPDAELPDLSGLFAQARREADGAPGRSRRGGGRLIAAAAVAGLVVGAGGVALGTQLGGATGRTVALTAFDKGTHRATARLSSSTLTVDATSLPALDADHRYEIWLTDKGRTQMQPVGWIGANGKARLSVPHDLVAHYDAIEVSVQQVTGRSYDYSGTSVLRGTYG